VRAEAEAGGMAFRCTADGRIAALLNDDFGAGVPAEPGGSLAQLVDLEDAPRVRAFLSALRENGSAFDWQFHVRSGTTRLPLHFAGVRQGDVFVVFAAPLPAR